MHFLLASLFHYFIFALNKYLLHQTIIIRKFNTKSSDILAKGKHCIVFSLHFVLIAKKKLSFQPYIKNYIININIIIKMNN